MKYLGIDWGEKRIGLATADSEIKLALPLGTVADLAGVVQAISDEAVDLVVLGRPDKMSGRSEGLTPGYENFSRLLSRQISCPIEYVDERLTSRAADALGGPKKLRAGRDEIAASLILQAYLDRLD